MSGRDRCRVEWEDVEYKDGPQRKGRQEREGKQKIERIQKMRKPTGDPSAGYRRRRNQNDKGQGRAEASEAQVWLRRASRGLAWDLTTGADFG